MYPPATGCSVSEAFSLEPFSQGNTIENFDGFGNNSYESILKQPNINEPSTQEISNIYNRPNIIDESEQNLPSNQVVRQDNSNVHRDIHIVNNNRQTINRPDNINRPSTINRPGTINRPLHMNKPINHNTNYVKHPRKKQNTDNNWLWIIIGILILLNIILSVMYIRK